MAGRPSFPTSRPVRLLAAASCLGLSVLLAACSKSAPTEEPVRAVKVVTVGVQNIQSGAEFAGEVWARVESRLGFRVAGNIIQRPVDAGQRVKAGQLLAQLEQAQAQLSSQRNQAIYTSLLADVSGVVVAVEAERGQLVAAGTTVFRMP